jgi:hypothetical protein
MNLSIKNWYSILISLFSVLFIGSVIFVYIDLRPSYEEYKHLE